MKRNVIMNIAMSIDGYIAKSDGNIDFLSGVEYEGEDYGFLDFLSHIDTVIWGRKTFDKVLSITNILPHKDKNVYVISKSRSGTHEHVVYHPDVVQLIMDLKQAEGKDIYCDGGGEIVSILLTNALVDRIIISVIPHMLGSGIRLFREGIPEKPLSFKQSITYPSGLVQLWYDVGKAGNT